MVFSSEAMQRGNSSGIPHAPQVVVVGVDASPTSWDAFAWAAGTVARSNGRLVAVHVAPLGEPAAACGAPVDYAGVERRDKKAPGTCRPKPSTWRTNWAYTSALSSNAATSPAPSPTLPKS